MANVPLRPRALARWSFVAASCWLLTSPGVRRALDLGSAPALIDAVQAAPRDPDPPPAAPVFRADPIATTLRDELSRKSFKVEQYSGNFLSARVFAKTRREALVPVTINGKLAKDQRGQIVFLRESIRARLLAADKAMFDKKHQHITINYGFRSNTLQQELYIKLKGKGKVAPPGESFHETGMALDLINWRDAQRYMIEAGFVGGCYGIEEDLVHYSVDEITKASNLDASRRCTLKDIPDNIVKGAKKAGTVGKNAGKAAVSRLKKK